MKKSPKKTQATHTTAPKAANLEASAQMKEQPSLAAAIDGELLEMAARGCPRDLSAAFKKFEQMSVEEVRLTRRALFRLEDWLDSFIIGNWR